jgi:ATP-dependent Lon protease
VEEEEEEVLEVQLPQLEQAEAAEAAEATHITHLLRQTLRLLQQFKLVLPVQLVQQVLVLWEATVVREAIHALVQHQAVQEPFIIVPTEAEAALEQVLRVTEAEAEVLMLQQQVAQLLQQRVERVLDLLAEEWVQTMMV